MRWKVSLSRSRYWRAKERHKFLRRVSFISIHALKSPYTPTGKSCLMIAPSQEPQGAVVLMLFPPSLDGGHRRATGFIFLGGASPAVWAVVTAKLTEMMDIKFGKIILGC